MNLKILKDKNYQINEEKDHYLITYYPPYRDDYLQVILSKTEKKVSFFNTFTKEWIEFDNET